MSEWELVGKDEWELRSEDGRWMACCHRLKESQLWQWIAGRTGSGLERSKDRAAKKAEKHLGIKRRKK